MTTKPKSGAKAPAPKEAKATSGGVAREGCMSAFNPFAATFEEAQATQSEYPDKCSPTGPFFQWEAAQWLAVSRAQVERGDGFGVLQAVAECALHGLVMPAWLVTLYLCRYRSVQLLRVKSWDHPSAFGPPYPGKQLSAMRLNRINGMRVWLLVNDYVKRDPDRPLDPLWSEFDRKHSEESTGLDDAEFEDRVRQIRIGSTKAQTLYAEAVRMHGYDYNDIRQAQGARRVPTKLRKLAGSSRKP